MNIDAHFAALTERRGITRQRLGALIRIIRENDEYSFEGQEAQWALMKALSAGRIHLASGSDRSDRLIYDIPIARNVSFREHRAGGIKDLAGKIMWDWTVVVHLESQNFPDTVMMAHAGKPLRAVIDHPELPGDRIVRTIARVDNGTAVVLEPDDIETSVDLPARQYRQEIERQRLKAQRKRDCIEVSAHAGLTTRSGAFALLAMCLLAATVTGIINGWPTLWTILSSTTAIYAASIAARSWLREDDYLIERINQHRTAALIRSRSLIHEGIAGR